MSLGVLAVDIGTSAVKAAVFEPDGTLVRKARRAYPLLEDEPGAAEQDPEAVVAAVLEAMREVLAPGDVAGVAFSSAMHSLVGLDAAGRPLTHLITWADTRAVAQAERLARDHPDLHARTGTPLHPMAPLAKLVWLREARPETFAAVRRWVGVKELVLHRLTGEWAMDHSVASGTGLMDLRRLEWHPEALAIAGVTADQLPRLVPAKKVFDWEVPLVAGAGDGPLANLGVGAVRPGVAACSIGTSGALRLIVEEPGAGPGFCYALTPGRWAVGGAISNGGVVLQWAREALAPELGLEELLDLAAQAPPGCDGLTMLPYLLSERAPHWSAGPRGAYVGLTRAHRRGHLVRAALEGVCLQLALVLASLEGVREVRATGGFARSPLWRQMLADALGMPLAFAESREGSAFGAALVGMEALGLVDTIDVAASLVRIGEVVEPDAEAAALYARRLETFEVLYRALGTAEAAP